MLKVSGLRGLLPIYVFLFFSGVTWGMPDVVLPLFVRSLGVSVKNWGLLVSIFAIGMLLFEAFWGLLSDRIGKSIMLVSSALVLSILFPFYALRFLIPYFAVLQFFRGCFAVIMAPTSRSYISAAVTPQLLATAMGLWWATLFLGRMFGSIIGGSIAEIWTYEYAFYACSIFAFFGAVLLLKTKPKIPRKKTHDVAGDATDKKNGNFVWRLKTLGFSGSVGILFLLAFTTMAGFSLMASFLPIFLAEQLTITVFEVGIVMAIFSGVSMIATPLMGRASDKIGRKTLIVVGSGLFGLALIGYVFSSNIYHLMLVTVGVAASLCAIMPCTLAILTEIIPSNRSGLMMGLYGTFEDLAGIVTPSIYSYVWSVFSPMFIFYACAGIQAFGVILGFTLAKISH